MSRRRSRSSGGRVKIKSGSKSVGYGGRAASKRSVADVFQASSVVDTRTLLEAERALITTNAAAAATAPANSVAALLAERWQALPDNRKEAVYRNKLLRELDDVRDDLKQAEEENRQLKEALGMMVSQQQKGLAVHWSSSTGDGQTASSSSSSSSSELEFLKTKLLDLVKSETDADVSGLGDETRVERVLGLAMTTLKRVKNQRNDLQRRLAKSEKVIANEKRHRQQLQDGVRTLTAIVDAMKESGNDGDTGATGRGGAISHEALANHQMEIDALTAKVKSLEADKGQLTMECDALQRRASGAGGINSVDVALVSKVLALVATAIHHVNTAGEALIQGKTSITHQLDKIGEVRQVLEQKAKTSETEVQEAQTAATKCKLTLERADEEHKMAKASRDADENETRERVRTAKEAHHDATKVLRRRVTELRMTMATLQFLKTHQVRRVNEMCNITQKVGMELATLLRPLSETSADLAALKKTMKKR